MSSSPPPITPNNRIIPVPTQTRGDINIRLSIKPCCVLCFVRRSEKYLKGSHDRNANFIYLVRKLLNYSFSQPN